MSKDRDDGNHDARQGSATRTGSVRVSVTNTSADLERAVRRLAIQDSVTRLLADSSTVIEAMCAVLREIGTSTGCRFGTWWQIHPQVIVLRCEAAWSAPGFASDELDRATRQSLYRPGVGLAGRVWQNERAEWSHPLRESGDLRVTQARRDELGSAFAVPVQTGRETFGVIELLGPDTLAPDEDLLRMLTAVGSQIGQFIKRTRSRQALQDSEARKIAILESALDSIVSVDHYGNVVEWNPAAERMFGRPRAEAIGKELADLIVLERHRATYRQLLARYYSTGDGIPLGERFEISALRASGEEFPVEVAITRIPSGGPPMFTGYVRDITERKRAEEQLGRTSGLLQTIFSGSTDGIWVKDLQGRFLLANPATAANFGLSVADIIGKSPAELGGPDFAAQVRESDSIVHEQGISITVDQTLALNGVPRVVQVTKSPYRDACGMVIGVIGIVRDITERKRAEEVAHFLAEASQVLGSSLDYHETLSSLAWLAVPTLTDYCFIDLVNEAGEIRRLVVAHDDPERVRWMKEMFSRVPPSRYISPWGSPHVIRSGQSQIIDDITDERLRQIAVDDEHHELLKQIGEISYIGVPLRSGGRVLGAIAFITADSGRRYNQDDLALAEELARRASSAIENARLYREAQTALDARRRTEEEKERLIEQLAHQRSRVDEIFAQLPGVVFEVYFDENGMQSLYLSPYTEIMLGYPVSAHDDPTFWTSLLHPDDRGRALREDAEIMARAGTGTSEYRMIARNGRVLNVSTTISAIVDAQGKVIGKRGITLDLTPTGPAGSALRSSTSLITIDPISFTVSKGMDKSAPLTSREFQIVVLMHNAGSHRISRSDLVNGIWGKLKVSTNSLDVHLFNLRKKLAPLGLEITFSPPNLYTLVERERAKP